jgi:hypothetical protein
MSKLSCSIPIALALACSGPKTPDPQPTEAASVAPSTEAAAPEASGMGLSPRFRERAVSALQFIGETLGRGATHNNEAEFESDLAEARAMVNAARESVVTDSDRRAALLLTFLVSKDKERYQAVLLSSVHGASYDTVQGTIQQLYGERRAVELRVAGADRGRRSWAAAALPRKRAGGSRARPQEVRSRISGG